MLLIIISSSAWPWTAEKILQALSRQVYLIYKVLQILDYNLAVQPRQRMVTYFVVLCQLWILRYVGTLTVLSFGCSSTYVCLIIFKLKLADLFVSKLTLPLGQQSLGEWVQAPPINHFYLRLHIKVSHHKIDKFVLRSSRL